MRSRFPTEGRFDLVRIEDVSLNLECRDEIVPILAALQEVFRATELRDTILDLVAGDLNSDSRRDVGRPGLDDWHVIVLATLRLGCNLNYDKLQDLAENHRALRDILGVGEWDDSISFDYRRLRDTIALLRPQTLEQINHQLVGYGQQLHGEARAAVRADSFVVETDVHYPTESSLIWDGVRKMVPLCVELAPLLEEPGWRQSKYLLKRIKEKVRAVSQISASKSPSMKANLPAAYTQLLRRTTQLLERARVLQIKGEKLGSRVASIERIAEQLKHWIELTEQVCDTARRRVLLGEKVPNSEKLFSLFETHTQLYRRGKAGQPNQFGRLVLVYEDQAGFLSHYHLMNREAQDADVIVEQTRRVQELHQGEIEQASFDRGFYSPENFEQLSQIVNKPCLPPRNPQQYAAAMAESTVDFRRARQHHPGIESAIGALQSGNGLKRCRDHTEVGFERYLGLAVLGRNLHVLGRLLISRRNSQCHAAKSKRKAA